MPLSTQPYKGARDFYPEDKRLQKYMFQIMRQVAERFGYVEYDAPILEPTELFASKTSEEIVNEQTYTFTDRGDRSVTIRTEMTPSVSRMVAGRRQELAYPLRWYSIPNFWRYERPQRGRLREFWQLNVDLFGVSCIEADHEMVLIGDQLLRAYGAQSDMYVIKLNSRKLVDYFVQEKLGISGEPAVKLVRLIDHMHKLDETNFESQLQELLSGSQANTDAAQTLQAFLKTTSLDQLSDELKEQQPVRDLQRLIELLEKSSVTNFQFDPTLMRGFDYYTDIVFEVFDTDPRNNRSMMGGGRYDGLVGLFGVEPVATVGFAMGDATLQNFLEGHKLLPNLDTETDVYAVLIGDVYLAAQPILAELRNKGINVAVDNSGRKPDKQIKTAVKQDIRYALFIGEKELETGQFTVKDLNSGDEQTATVETIAIKIAE